MRTAEETPPALRPPSDDPVPRIALRPTEAAKAIGVCERFLRDLGRDGPPYAQVGSVRLYPIATLEQWLIALATRKAEASTDGVDAEAG